MQWTHVQREREREMYQLITTMQLGDKVQTVNDVRKTQTNTSQVMTRVLQMTIAVRRAQGLTPYLSLPLLNMLIIQQIRPKMSCYAFVSVGFFVFCFFFFTWEYSYLLFKLYQGRKIKPRSEERRVGKVR